MSRSKYLAEMAVNINWILIGIWIFYVGSTTSITNENIWTANEEIIFHTIVHYAELIGIPVALNVLLTSGISKSSIPRLRIWLFVHVLISIVGYLYIALKACQGALEPVHFFELFPLGWLTLNLLLIQNFLDEIVCEKISTNTAISPISDEIEKSTAEAETDNSIYNIV